MKCFVIMPFGDPDKDRSEYERLTNIFEQWIKPTVESIVFENKNIECTRADKIFKTGDIINHIIDNIVNSEIVIADLSNRNPNVFYELGVRHSISNNTILISSNVNDIPFDLRPLRAISYDYTPDKMLKFKTDLERTINSILKSPNDIDNPVRRYLLDKEVTKIMSNNNPPGYDFIKDLLSEFKTLKLELNNQSNSIKNLIDNITSVDKKESIKTHAFDLNLIEGIWHNNESDSLVYVKIINGQIYMPYSYGNRKELTAHYYNCKLIGKTIYARFKWFRSEDIRGYAIYEIINDNRIEGGWLMEDDIPDNYKDYHNLPNYKDLMVNTDWVKISNLDNLPPYITNYFDKIEKQKTIG